MAHENWQQVKEIFADALRQTPEMRPEFLDSACRDDKNLRREVESLLTSFDSAESFMETPAVGEMPDVSETGAHRLESGTRFGHYEIIALLGTGGMGEVYLAEDTKLDRKVAVKILNEKFSRHESNLDRFIREAKAASSLNHPNILVIHEIGEADYTHYIVSEFVEGKTLREIFKEKNLELKECLDISIQVANALSVAHEAHLIHRDIKPENMIIRPDGYIKILDFGLAKLIEKKKSFIDLEVETAKQNQTGKGVIMGTVNYMSPEQAKGERTDERTDIFSLGVVIYEMIAGRTPFAGDSMSETFANLLNQEPQPLVRFAANVPDELNRIVTKMLRKNKDERYQTMKGLLADLKDLKENLTFEEKLERTAPPNYENATAILKATTADLNEQTAATQNSFLAPIKQKPFAVFFVIGLLLATVGLGYYFFAVKKAATNADVQKPLESIAVLPFTNESGDANFDYLSDGLSESVIDRLAQLPQIKVIARNSSFKYRGNDLDLQEIANALGVQAIVTGRVVQRGENLSVRVEMIDVRDNRQLWSDSYNRRATDVQAVQAEIAQTVSEKLRLRLTGAQEQQLAKAATANPEAYQLYLTGLFVAKTDLKKSLDYFTQATTLDPNFALAFYRLSWCYYYLGYNSVLDPKETTPKARAALQRALELDDTLAEAHLLMAEIKRKTGDQSGAESALNRVLELNPNTADAHGIKAEHFKKAGKIEEAVSESRLAQQLDPLAIPRKIQEGAIFYHARRFDEALTKFQQIVKLVPDQSGGRVWLGYAYAGKGMYREAIAEYQQSIKLGGDNTSDRCYLGYALAKSGKRDEAIATLDKLKTGKDYVSHAELAILYIGLGDKDAAFETLEKAYAEHDLQLQNLKSDPHFDDLHDDPRFLDLIRRIGLP
jgi:serine/threonine-protein kinase